MMQKKFTLYNFETFRSRDHGSVPVITGAAGDVITGAAYIGYSGHDWPGQIAFSSGLSQE